MSCFKSPSLTVDTIIVMDKQPSIVLIKRQNPPFKDMWALPGGFVDYGESVEKAAIRETEEETGLEVELLHLLGVYSEPARDPRGHTVSVVYIAKHIGGVLKAADDAKEVGIFTADEISMMTLAFDHNIILADAFSVLPKIF